MHWRFGAVAVITIALLSAGPSFAEPAPDADDAAVHVDRGTDLLGKGRNAAALAEFETAHRLSGSWKVLVHIGVAQARLERYEEAMATLERYLDQGKNEVPEATQAMVKREIDRIRKYFAWVTITVEGGDAEVKVDGKVIGRAPLKGPIPLWPRDHTIVVRRPGFKDRTEHLTGLSMGTQRTVPFTLERLPGLLRVDTRPTGAQVFLDGRPVGLSTWEKWVAPGLHEVQVRLRGYVDRRQAVHLESGRTSPLSFDLVLAPPPPPKAWYRRWYVWTVIGGAVVAAVVTAAVVATWPHYDNSLYWPPGS